MVVSLTALSLEFIIVFTEQKKNTIRYSFSIAIENVEKYQ